MLQGKNKLTINYTASIPFDQRLYRQDIKGSIAHASMLAKQGIITESDAKAIIKGLNSIREEIEQGKFPFSTELEDIHMNIEARLFEKIGDVAGKLHTARSRNDQVTLDMRLFLKEEIPKTIDTIKALQSSLVELAEVNKEVIMPGYTHLQQAQPVLLAHHLLAYFEMFQRDKERFSDCLKRTDVLPLGSGALAGVAYPVDRQFLAQELGFSEISNNSIDAVSDRDFVVEFQAAAALTMMHISRLAEEIVLWSSSEFGFIEIGKDFTTGSSIMPQKKNPDVAELARGKTGRIYGNLMSIITTMKGLPLAYNRDMQEDKQGLFDTLDTLHSTLEIFAEMLKTIKVNTRRVREAIKDYILATDLADYLVKKGMPFREAYSVVAKLSEYAINKGKNFRELSLKEYDKFSPLFTEDVYNITLESSIAARNVIGGTSPQQVEQALKKARESI
ncbi:MAG: argininosuccinate lyase [Chloroflexi bacterium CG15_BIG_FIL_POST_REV_8_21_14_020_46_15]|nr:MAG: argininosuccinate lyase [Dehalococcoidia bacterium CG2_30_46_19]PIW40113.1 MAG: argininosuccinate lyase [Chloroflexi bacterium CG15_BIG_FIL_POST_REV_8_21_14_020_46_15]